MIATRRFTFIVILDDGIILKNYFDCSCIDQAISLFIKYMENNYNSRYYRLTKLLSSPILK